MEDYRFETMVAMPTNEDTMSCFLNSDEHFYSRFDDNAQITLEEGTYAEVVNGDGVRYGVHAGGDGDFFKHRIRFEILYPPQTKNK